MSKRIKNRLIPAAEQAVPPRRQIENLAVTAPLLDPAHERKKQELRARLEAERTAPSQTVLSHREQQIEYARYWAERDHTEKAKSESLVFRDPDDIRPTRPITAADLAEVVSWHSKFEILKSFQLGFEIGFKLRCWKDLMPESQWQQWLVANVPQIPSEAVHHYILLWDNHEQLRNGMRLSPMAYECALFPDRWKG